MRVYIDDSDKLIVSMGYIISGATVSCSKTVSMYRYIFKHLHYLYQYTPNFTCIALQYELYCADLKLTTK